MAVQLVKIKPFLRVKYFPFCHIRVLGHFAETPEAELTESFVVKALLHLDKHGIDKNELLY